MAQSGGLEIVQGRDPYTCNIGLGFLIQNVFSAQKGSRYQRVEIVGLEAAAGKYLEACPPVDLNTKKKKRKKRILIYYGLTGSFASNTPNN